MLLPPFGVIAEWPHPIYVNPQTRGPALFVLNTTFQCLSTIFVLARVYTRARIVRWFGMDDIFIVVAWVCDRLRTNNFADFCR